MPNLNQLPDDLFESYLENLLLTGKTNTDISSLIKSPKEKIDKHRQNIKQKWLSSSSRNETGDYNLAITEAKLLKLYEIAYKAFIKSQAQYKIIYKNDVENPNGPVVNHRIHPKGAGDIQWLKLILDIIKQQSQLAKIDKTDMADTLDDYLEFVQWKETQAIEHLKTIKDDCELTEYDD
jgi:hypothetical protein